jgi:hypothetical protein
MLGLAIAIKAEVIGQAHITADFFEKPLIQVVALPGHSGLDLMTAPHDTSLHQMEFHRLNPQSVLSTLALI